MSQAISSENPTPGEPGGYPAAAATDYHGKNSATSSDPVTSRAAIRGEWSPPTPVAPGAHV